MFGTTGSTFASLVGTIMGLVYTLEWLLSGIALLVFMVGVIRFMRNAGNTKNQQAGYLLMVWGIIALFVLFSIGGILSLMCGSLLPGSSCSFFYWTGGAPT